MASNLSLIHIYPKSIGVGQYQHDMPQTRLGEALDGVVEDCVNAVGVDLNTASPALLRRVAGISQTVSKNIAQWREENGRFDSRAQLKKVKGLGPKAFEQCAGFLRVPDGKNLLDRTGVHPEAYKAAETLLMLCGYTVADAAQGKISELTARVKQIGLSDAAERCGVGVPTLTDIIEELQKPGRDPRDELPPPLLRSDVDVYKRQQFVEFLKPVLSFGKLRLSYGLSLIHISNFFSSNIKLSLG